MYKRVSNVISSGLYDYWGKWVDITLTRKTKVQTNYNSSIVSEKSSGGAFMKLENIRVTLHLHLIFISIFFYSGVVLKIFV